MSKSLVWHRFAKHITLFPRIIVPQTFAPPTSLPSNPSSFFPSETPKTTDVPATSFQSFGYACPDCSRIRCPVLHRLHQGSIGRRAAVHTYILHDGCAQTVRSYRFGQVHMRVGMRVPAESAYRRLLSGVALRYGRVGSYRSI